jgi:hypothetical protein
MHLLLNPSFELLFGEVITRHGRIESLSLTTEGEAAIGQICSSWREQGIGTLYANRSAHDDESMIQFARETIPFSSPQAFLTLQNEAAHHGFIVCSLDQTRVPYWKEIQAIPMTHRSRAGLLFMLKNMSDQDLPLWNKLWTQTVLKGGT